VGGKITLSKVIYSQQQAKKLRFTAWFWTKNIRQPD